LIIGHVRVVRVGVITGVTGNGGTPLVPVIIVGLPLPGAWDPTSPVEGRVITQHPLGKIQDRDNGVPTPLDHSKIGEIITPLEDEATNKVKIALLRDIGNQDRQI